MESQPKIPITHYHIQHKYINKNTSLKQKKWHSGGKKQKQVTNT
jgi:hypothetical protein